MLITPAPLLEINDLAVDFTSLPALRGVSLNVQRGETLGIVGESGSGKSITWLAALGLLGPEAKISGSVRFDGQELIGAPARTLESLRGRRIAIVFQDATDALNPMRSAGWQVAEALTLHRGLRGAALKAETRRLFDLVGLPDPARLVQSFPHELSGGQNQRVMIAMALAGQPDLLIADEPTTALDATVQAQILEMLEDVRRETGMALVLISHDLAVVAQNCARVAVMYAGRIVESGPTTNLLAKPLHPYTIGLLNALPALEGPRRKLVPIRGAVPSQDAMPVGCAFGPRCEWIASACARPQTLRPMENDRLVACIRRTGVAA